MDKPKLEIPIGIQYTSLHHIDYNNNAVPRIDINSESEKLGEYINRLIKDIEEKKSKRSFNFSSDTTEVRSAIAMMINGDYDTAAEINAKRLLKIECETQLKVQKITSIQKGSLFQAVINIDQETKMIIIGKAEHNAFLDASDFEIHNGLPWKKKIFKSFLAIIKHNSIDKIFVSDTTSSLSKYWWSSFLELTEKRTDNFNTITFLNMIDKKVLDNIKIRHPADHTFLRNSVIGYFRSRPDFDLDNMIENIFEHYTPVEETININQIKQKIIEIPNKYDLDSQFKIDKEAINKRAVHKIILSDSMELFLKGTPNLNNIIRAYNDEEGNKGIIIKTEEGYKRFKDHESI